ncbi:MAG: serine hydrolase [Streptosporangiales bacterium]|nr:serine hydrolase [Streptosporangiales bacterium]
MPVRPGEFIATLGFISGDYIAIELASIRLGAVSVPLQTSATPSNLRPVVAETGPRVLAVSVENLGAAAEIDVGGETVRKLVVCDYVPGAGAAARRSPPSSPARGPAAPVPPSPRCSPPTCGSGPGRERARLLGDAKERRGGLIPGTGASRPGSRGFPGPPRRGLMDIWETMDRERVDEFIAGQLDAWEVPGCAIAAVRGGEGELAGGWGYRDAEAGLPVTPDTLFSVASLTKAFTASVIGALADDGLLEWDRPVRDYAPDVRLHDPVVTERLTITDLLAHRSGLPRHDLAWIGHPDRSRADLVRRLRFLPLSRDLRQAFQYCNFGYLAAGHVADVVSGGSWEELARDRLLGPLGMTRSNLSVGELVADPDHATGYLRLRGEVRPVPPRPRPAMAPGGGINSCAADMARWLLAQLGDGTEVLSPATRKRQHAPHMVMGARKGLRAYSRSAYGLGWSIGRYRDRPALMHSGSIDGFKAHCVLLPDDGAGAVVLTNGSSRLMPLTVACRVLDELLGAERLDLFSVLKPRADAARTGARQARAARRVVAGAVPPRPLAEYAGVYEHPGYGTLTVTLDGDVLKPAFGTMRLSLSHRHYETFDLRWHERDDPPALYPLTFVSDPDGDITALDARFEASVGPLRFARIPEVPGPGVLERLCGTYAMGPATVTIALRAGRRLTLSAGRGPALDLEPVRGLRFRVKDRPGTAEFDLDDRGGVARLVVQPTGIFYPKPAEAQ